MQIFMTWSNWHDGNLRYVSLAGDRDRPADHFPWVELLIGITSFFLSFSHPPARARRPAHNILNEGHVRYGRNVTTVL